MAKVAIQESFDVLQHDERTLPASDYKNDAHYETGLIELEPGAETVLWLHSYHPGNYGHFNPQRKHCWPLYAEAAGRFWLSR